MFKTTDKINKAMDLIMKASEEIENEERKDQALEAVHILSKLQQDCFSDIAHNK